MIYICIPIYNKKNYTLQCLESIKKQTYPHYRVLVCDDGSTDESYEHISRGYPEVILLRGDGNLWWAGATNAAVRKAMESARVNDFIYTLNNDTELFPNTLKNLVESSKRFPDSIIGTVNLFEDEADRIEPSAFQAAGKGFFSGIYRKVNDWGEPLHDRSDVVEVDSLSGKGVLIPISVFQKIGLYHSQLLPHYHSDTEFTVRAKKSGFHIYLDYHSRLKSHQHSSGIGTITSEPSIRDFVDSFSSVRSVHHYRSLKNRCMILYGDRYPFHLTIHLAIISMGFIKRYLKHHLTRRPVKK
jgi:GT2 family glycosyltransferase